MGTKISIQILQSAPIKTRPEYKLNILDKVRDYVRDINSNIVDSYQQWQYLKRVYNVLSKRNNLSEEECQILEILEPEIMKQAEYDTEDAAELDGTNMFKYMNRD